MDLLREPDRRLIEQLYWERCTECEVAERLGISHQAVSRRKRTILDWLRDRIGMSKEFRDF